MVRFHAREKGAGIPVPAPGKPPCRIRCEAFAETRKTAIFC
jgi:hypothetical protein